MLILKQLLNLTKRKKFLKLLIIIFCFGTISLGTSIATLAQEQNEEQTQKTSKNADDSQIGTWASLLTAIATLATIGVLIWQIRNSDKVAEGGFLLQLHKDFFFDSSNAIVIKAIEEGKPILKQNGGLIEEDVLNNYLGMIELLSIFTEKKNMDEETVDSMFGYYIVKTWNNSEIQQYVKKVRTDEKYNGYYGGLEELACKFKDA